MSGHSKWHNIQAHKGKQDAARSSQFTKVAKLIAVAARSGGDPASNFSLRLAIEKAKDAMTTQFTCRGKSPDSCCYTCRFCCCFSGAQLNSVTEQQPVR